MYKLDKQLKKDGVFDRQHLSEQSADGQVAPLQVAGEKVCTN